jgi:hypothetical protein
MQYRRTMAAVSALVLLAACGATDRVAREQPLAGADLVARPVAATAPGEQARMPRWSIRSVRVEVPQSLTVSEANVFYPVADIVWRGEPRGDRHAQVKAILEEAVARAGEAMTGPAADVEIEVLRFHGVTEKTRYTVGGIYAVHFVLTVRDAATGAILDGPRTVRADIRASGGQRAIEEESRGLTQRVVLVHNLAHVAWRELTVPVGLQRRGAVPVSRIDSDLMTTPVAVSMTEGRFAGE